MNQSLINARKKMGLTQVQTSNLANITERTYQAYEAGRQTPRTDIAIRIAQVLNTSVEILFSTK